MNMGQITFRGRWFKAQEDKLGTVAEQLRCINQEISGVRYTWDESYHFAPFKGAYQAMVTSLTTGTNGALKGIELLRQLQDAVVTTGREYLRTEGTNEGLAAEVEKLIQELDL